MNSLENQLRLISERYLTQVEVESAQYIFSEVGNSNVACLSLFIPNAMLTEYRVVRSSVGDGYFFVDELDLLPNLAKNNFGIYDSNFRDILSYLSGDYNVSFTEMKAPKDKTRVVITQII